MHLWLCTLFVALTISLSWATSRNVTLTNMKETLQKSPPTTEVHSDGSKTGEILNRIRQYFSWNGYRLTDTTLKWVEFQGSAPSGAVSIWNSYSKRTEYPCYELECKLGFYSPAHGSYCFYPDSGHEKHNTLFWLLVNENNFESLKWQRHSWGNVPTNSVRTCENSTGYVGKNKYGLGKIDPFSQAFYIGINGKQYWYRSYDVLVVDKDCLSQRINNVRYMKERGEYNRSTSSFTTKITNKDCQTTKQGSTFSSDITNQHQWHFISDISRGGSILMTTGIFSVVNGIWNLSQERTFRWSEGSTMTEKFGISLNVENTVPPKHICNVISGDETVFGYIPFTATVTREYRYGEMRSTTIQGVSQNTIVTHMDYDVERCQPIPRATPCP